MIRRSPAYVLGHVECMTETDSARVRALVARVGSGRATKFLGIGRETMDAARDQGRMHKDTRARILAALDRENV